MQHAEVKEEGVSGEVRIQEASDDGVVNEGIWLGHLVEQVECIIQVAVLGERTELDEAAHGVVVGGEAEADGSGVELLEVGHGGTPLQIMAAQWGGCHHLHLVLERQRHFAVCRFEFSIIKPENPDKNQLVRSSDLQNREDTKKTKRQCVCLCLCFFIVCMLMMSPIQLFSLIESTKEITSAA